MVIGDTTESEWHKLKRAVVNELPAVERDAVATERTFAVSKWPGQASEIADAKKLTSTDPTTRKESDQYQLLHILNAFEWFSRLSDISSFAIAGCIVRESFVKSELIIIAAAAREALPDTGLTASYTARASARLPTTHTEPEEDEHFYIVLEGVLALQYGRRVAGHLYPGQAWASFAAAAGRRDERAHKPLEVRALEPASVIVVTKTAFSAVMASSFDEQFRQKVDFLTSIPLLRGLDRKSLRPFVEKLQLEKVHKDSVLIKQGELPTKLYFVLSGEARVLRHVPESAFREAEMRAEATSHMGVLVPEDHSIRLTRAQGDDRMIAISAGVIEPGDDAQADQSAERILEKAARADTDPLSVPGRTLELRRLGPRDFFGELAILSEHVGGRSLASIVSCTDMKLFSIHTIDFRNTADAEIEALFRANASRYVTDSEIIASLIDGRQWRGYKRALVKRMVNAHAVRPPNAPPIGERPRAVPQVRPPGATNARVRANYYICQDGFSTPVERASLFDMAVRSARKAATAPPPPGSRPRKGQGRPPPMPELPDIATHVNDSAARAGISHAGSRAPPAPTPVGVGRRAKARPRSHWVDDARQWDKFKSWGTSATGRAAYKARFDMHFNEASEEVARRRMDAAS